MIQDPLKLFSHQRWLIDSRSKGIESWQQQTPTGAGSAARLFSKQNIWFSLAMFDHHIILLFNWLLLKIPNLQWDRSIFQHFNFHLNSLCAPGWIRGSAVYRLTHERFAILCIPLTSRVVSNFTFYYLINWLCSCGSLLSTFRSDPGVKLGIWLALKAVSPSSDINPSSRLWLKPLNLLVCPKSKLRIKLFKNVPKKSSGDIGKLNPILRGL